MGDRSSQTKRVLVGSANLVMLERVNTNAAISRRGLLPFKGSNPLESVDRGGEREGEILGKGVSQIWGKGRENERAQETVFVGGKWIKLDNGKGIESEKGVAWWETETETVQSVRIMVEREKERGSWMT